MNDVNETPGAVTLTDVGIKVVADKIRRRTHGKIPQVLGTTYTEVTWPLRHLTVQVEPGEVLAVFDATDVRETLVLRTMCSKIRPDEGTVRSLPRPAFITRPTRRDVKSLSLGQVIQLLSGLMGMSDSEIRERFDAIAEMAEVSGILQTSTEEMEIGLARQIAFAAGTMMPTQLFAFDRSLPVGPTEFREKCLPSINLLRDRGAVVIATIPQVQNIRKYADRGLLLDGEEAAVLPVREFAAAVEAAQKIHRDESRRRRRGG